MQAQREQNSRTIMDAPCVVTGGAGAIGSRLVRRLLELGASRVVVIDDLSSGYRWLLPNDARVEFLKHDIQNIGEAIPKLPPSCVFHLAALFANQNTQPPIFELMGWVPLRHSGGLLGMRRCRLFTLLLVVPLRVTTSTGR
jgi:hypothetical protein